MRERLDQYETPMWMTRALLWHHHAIAGTRVLEPCSGQDALSNVLRHEGQCLVFTNDIDPAMPAQTHQDATLPEFWATAPAAAWVISNPPFSVAFPIITQALRHASIGVAMLLRKSWTEPTRERGAWLAAHPPTRVIGLPRHSFTGKGKDTVAADWFLWEHFHAPGLRPFVIDPDAKRDRVRL